jgi:uncharacterized protein YceK
MRLMILGISAAASAILLSGCATVVNGTHQELAFSTLPEGSAVTVTDGSTCTTPCKLKLARRHPVRVDLTQAGYKPAYVLVRSKHGGATLGNLLLGGGVGILVDANNGSNDFLTPDPVKVRLAAAGSTDESQLIDKKGNESPVSAHNDEARADVAPTIGAEAAGVVPPVAATPAPMPAPAPTAGPAPVPAPAAAPPASTN